jgi:hypothetical protein
LWAGAAVIFAEPLCVLHCHQGQIKRVYVSQLWFRVSRWFGERWERSGEMGSFVFAWWSTPDEPTSMCLCMLCKKMECRGDEALKR